VKFHLVGIGGTGMAGLAGLLRARGDDVRGSDEHLYPPMSTQLERMGVPVMNGFSADNLDWAPDRVVVGNVCRKDHVEVVGAAARGLRLVSFPATLGEEFLANRHSIVVAGTHGKTTTSALLAQILFEAGRDPSFLCGGLPLDFGRSFRLGGGDAFVVEGDEYDTAFFDKGPKFLHYRPRTAIVTAVEFDHADIYASLDAVVAAFRRFVALLPEDGTLVLGVDSPDAAGLVVHTRARVITYGKDAEFSLGRVEPAPGGRVRFQVRRGRSRFGDFEARLVGEHNLYNAIAAVAVAHVHGLDADAIGRGLYRFAGVARRQELRGVAQGVEVIDDFAHHPTAVRETLRALRERKQRGRLVAVFEPRSASSRRNVFQDAYAEAFAAADEVVVLRPRVDGVGEGERLDVDRLAEELHARKLPARVAATVDEIADHVSRTAQPGDTVAVMSSGGFGGLVDKLLLRLGDAVVPARAEDVGALGPLLERAALSRHGLDERPDDFLLLRSPDGAAGCVALERYREAALLRSLAVAPDRRGEGLGWLLAEAALDRARSAGLHRVFLLTTTAADFFAAKLGFRACNRQDVDADVARSWEFTSCPPNATCMVLDLRAVA
jgi:UDP-N-acetylmuramate: L-alanyl-gamma-D-glutamyl-meso-diaminopimelate ligase